MNKSVLMSHDLACALNALGGHACRYANTGGGTAPLAISAIAFTIQLAIETGKDPVAMRSLESTPTRRAHARKGDPMKDLVALNPKTGAQEPCGTIAAKRTIGDTTVWLTYDEASHAWWIVWKDDNVLRKIVYTLAHREEGWKAFRAMTEVDIAKLRAS